MLRPFEGHCAITRRHRLKLQVDFQKVTTAINYRVRQTTTLLLFIAILQIEI